MTKLYKIAIYSDNNNSNIYFNVQGLKNDL